MLLAIVLLIKGGVEYVTVDTFAAKAEGKETVQNALLGLILLFVSFLILKLINPTLISGEDLNIAKVTGADSLECSLRAQAARTVSGDGTRSSALEI